MDEALRLLKMSSLHSFWLTGRNKWAFQHSILCLAWEITKSISSFSLSEHSAVTKSILNISHYRRNKQAAVTTVTAGVVTGHRIVWVVRITQSLCSTMVRDWSIPPGCLVVYQSLVYKKADPNQPSCLPELCWLWPHFYGLGYLRKPYPRVTLVEVTFSLFLCNIQPTAYIRVTNLSWGVRLGWASCLASVGGVTPASGTTFLHINALAHLTGTTLGMASVALCLDLGLIYMVSGARDNPPPELPRPR